MSLIPHHTSDAICALCESKLALAHVNLQKWFHESVKPKNPNAHVSWSYRNAADQEEALEEGKTRLPFPHSAHNKVPAMALDLFQIDESGHALWDPAFFSALGKTCVADSPLFWGGHWPHLGDTDHFELKA